MLADLLEVGEGILLALHDGGHSSEGGPFELLASIKRVSELEETDIVLAHVVDEVLAGVDLSQGQLVVILVVEDVQEGSEEGVEVLRGAEESSVSARSAITLSVGRLTSRMGNSVRI